MPNRKKIKKTNTMKLLERMYGMDIYDLLKADYIDNKLTVREMAEKYGISHFSVQAWMKMFDIPRRKMVFM